MPRATDRESRTPTVSVVIAAYNAAPFIERSIRSALSQSHKVAEVIVVDDASTDATTAVVMRIIQEDERVKLLPLPSNGGPAKARNAGFAAATSEWIAVLDADDAYLPDRLSHLMSKSDEADILADSFLFYYPATNNVSGDTGNGWEEIDLATFADARRDHWDFGLYKPVFRRSFLERQELGYPEDVRHGEDYIFAFEAIARGARYWISWRPGYLYTPRRAGWSRTVVDYGGIRTAVTVLSERSDLGLSPEVRAKLRDRAAYSESLHLREVVKGALAEKRVVRALAIAATHPVIWKLALQKLRRDLFGS